MLKVVNLSKSMMFAGWTKVFCLKTLEKFKKRTINSSLNYSRKNCNKSAMGITCIKKKHI